MAARLATNVDTARSYGSVHGVVTGAGATPGAIDVLVSFAVLSTRLDLADQQPPHPTDHHHYRATGYHLGTGYQPADR
jgi:hypothetical protein